MTSNASVASDIEGLTKPTPLSRRLFMSAAAATAAGYTLAAGPVSAQVIQTGTDGLEVGDSSLTLPDGKQMPVYYAKPATNKNAPVILVAMEIFGLHAYIKDVTRRLAKLGAFAVAPDYYFRAGVDITKITDIPQLRTIVDKKPDSELLSDLDAAAGWAKTQGGDISKLGIVGFCRGGRAVWLYAAHNSQLKAGVSFYGSLVDPQNPVWPKSATQVAPDIKAPVLGLYGDADQGIPVAHVEAMRDALKGKAAEIKLYPGAPHGFHADYRPSYRKDAAEDAWIRMAAWFKTHGVLPS